MKIQVEIQSADVNKAILAELRKNPQKIPEDMRSLLFGVDASDEENFQAALKKNAIWIDVSPLLVTRKVILETQQDDDILHTLIERGAHFPMANELFGLNNKEYLKIRSRMGAKAPPLTKPPAVPKQLVDGVYDDWSFVSKKHTDDRLRWLEMSERYPALTLSSIYRLIKPLESPLEK
jgi:hypothetical protein